MDKDRTSIIALQQTKLTKTDHSQAKTSHKLLRDQPLNVQRRKFDIFLKLCMSGWHESFRLGSYFIATIYNFKTQNCSPLKPKKKKDLISIWTRLPKWMTCWRLHYMQHTWSCFLLLILFEVIISFNNIWSYFYILTYIEVFQG